jgi:molybdenum cofactor sulfurtransferase
MKYNYQNELKHDVLFEELRASEYSRLDKDNHYYLDYTGGNIYSDSQIETHFKLLKNNSFGNPHSSNPTSQLASKLIDEARDAVLRFFNADDYYCIFTQNATGALQIVGECYPFNQNSALLLLADNHNSVNGIREYCHNKKGEYKYTPIQFEDLKIDAQHLDDCLSDFSNSENKLFGYPAQSNVTGVKHDLEWIEKAHKKGWDVLLDAAAFVPSSKLDLQIHRPDFVSMSFYKIFGYPTGIGCLLVRKDKFHKLVKPWFAGGTVTLAAVKTPNHYLADDHERFENGTVNYLDIPAVKIGLDYNNKIGINKINDRIMSLMQYLNKNLHDIKHETGLNVARVFGPAERENCGGSIIMTFQDKNGHQFSFEEIEEMTNSRNISIRSGCFCNPGIDEVNNCLTNEELAKYFSSRDKGNYKDIVAFLHKMRGATRVSVGIATVKKDIDAFLDFVIYLKGKVI